MKKYDLWLERYNRRYRVTVTEVYEIGTWMYYQGRAVKVVKCEEQKEV